MTVVSLQEVIIDGVKHWLVTNDLAYDVDVEVRMASGTRVIARLPINGNIVLIPAIDEDANILASPASSEPPKLRLV
ncbi:hypothetical protein EGI97_17225 [Stutzerimonas xanthomarina]|nr:hypothetical protein EGI97_17225 [Stutzerimonas xanthomarina]